MGNRQEFEGWKCDGFSSDHLMAIVDHADSQIDRWQKRRNIALGHLASRGEILLFEHNESELND